MEKGFDVSQFDAAHMNPAQKAAAAEEARKSLIEAIKNDVPSEKIEEAQENARKKEETRPYGLN